jgi:hypothetical protein
MGHQRRFDAAAAIGAQGGFAPLRSTGPCRPKSIRSTSTPIGSTELAQALAEPAGNQAECPVARAEHFGIGRLPGTMAIGDVDCYIVPGAGDGPQVVIETGHHAGQFTGIISG